MPCFVGVIVVPMVVVGVIFMLFFGMIVVPVLIVMLFAVVVVPVSTFKFGDCNVYSTACSIGHYEQIQRRTKRGDGQVNRREVSFAFRSMFEPDNISARRFERHRDSRAFNRDIERSNTMLMSIKLARFFCEGRESDDKRKEGECVFHDIPSLV